MALNQEVEDECHCKRGPSPLLRHHQELKSAECDDFNDECETASTASFDSQDDIEEEGEAAPDVSTPMSGSSRSPNFSRPGRPGIIRVDSAAKRGWDILTVFVSIVFFWHSSLHPSDRREIISALEPLWFLTDIVLNFRTEIILSDGRSLRHCDEIVKHYVRTWFFLDLLLAIPFDLLVLAFTRKAPPLKNHRLRKLASRVGKAISTSYRRAKTAIGSKIPRSWNIPRKIKRMRLVLRFLAYFDIRGLRGVRHVVKHQSTYQMVGAIIRFLCQLLRLHVFSLFGRVVTKLWCHIAQKFPKRRQKSRKSDPKLSDSVCASDNKPPIKVD